MGKRKTRTGDSVNKPDGLAESEQPAKIAKTDANQQWRNKEKILLLSSRGITHRYIPRYRKCSSAIPANSGILVLVLKVPLLHLLAGTGI